MSGHDGASWMAKAMAATGTLVIVALAGRLVWEILSPLAGPLAMVMVLCGVFLFLMGQRQ